MKQIIKIFLFTILVLSVVNISSARLEMDSISFDPGIIASGDEVDILIQFHDKPLSGDESRVGNPDYQYGVTLESDDDLTSEYVTIQDKEGDDLSGTIYSGQYYNKVFRVKVNQNAPAGNYEFKLTGQWYKNGEPINLAESIKFMMPVKREGIILDVSTLETIPSEVRPGDNYVKVVAFIENSGQKNAKSVEVSLELEDGLEASYTNSNRIWVGRVNAGERKDMTFFVDVNEKAESKLYNIKYDFKYSDIDDNTYEKIRVIPFLVKSRPYIEVVKSEGSGLIGSSSKLYVTVKNTGSESAEAVDVRIIKENSQPFNFDVRSDYIGELEPGEEGTAVFDIDVTRDAALKNHYFKLLIRSKGDTDEGDDNIYTYSRRAEFNVDGEAPNNIRKFGLIGFALVIVSFFGNVIFKRRRGNKK